jgi:phage terminase large subunit-like protein
MLANPSSTDSLALSLAKLPEPRRRAILDQLSQAEAEALRWEWGFWARPKQIAPAGGWLFWFLCAGRGFGKTRTGAEWVRQRVKDGAKHIIFAGATASDLRDIMIEGESGILSIYPDGERPHYEPSKARLTWGNGAQALLLSADEPERFRGKQSDTIWADELAAWRYPEAWDQLMFGFRLGKLYGVKPKAAISTTPRPTPLIRRLLKHKRSVLTVGSSYENRANLTDEYVAEVLAGYEGTRLGRQELYAEILEDIPGALWTRQNIEDNRRPEAKGPFRRIIVAIDPAVTSNKDSDETGIVVVALAADDRHALVIEDASGRYTPDGWARRAIELYQRWDADAIVAEVNNGGDLVQFTVETVAQTMPRADGGTGAVVHYKAVHASRGKARRAEPIAALYEQGRVHHVGHLAKLEDELCTFDPMTNLSTVTDGLTGQLKGTSPGRMDATVWGLTELLEWMKPVNDGTPRAFPTKFVPGEQGANGAKSPFQW